MEQIIIIIKILNHTFNFKLKWAFYVSVLAVLCMRSLQHIYCRWGDIWPCGSIALPSLPQKSCWEAKKGWKWEKEKGQMSGHGRERIAKRCEHFSKMMFCASNILLTAAWSDPSIMCEYISSPGPPPSTLPPHPTSPQAHIPPTHTFPNNWRPSPPPHHHPSSSSFSSSTEVNYQNCVWKWMKGDLLSLSLALSLALSHLLFPFPLWHLSFFFLLATVSGLGDNCR